MAQYHENDVIFTEESLIGFIKSIHDNIKDNFKVVSTYTMMYKKKTNSTFNESEAEINEAFPYFNYNATIHGNITSDIINQQKISWNHSNGHGSSLCLINTEIEQIRNNNSLNNESNRNSGRYMWLLSAEQINFPESITHDGANNANNFENPIGTFRANKNFTADPREEVWVKIEGFDNTGNFDNQTTATSSYLKTDILYGKQLGSSTTPVTTAYITSLTATDAYITNLKLTSNSDAGFTSDGKLRILNNTEANRTVAAGVTATSADQLSGSIITLGGIAAGRKIMGERVYAAVFNDYAECRKTISLSPGRVVIDQDDGSLVCASMRLQPGAQVISDTYGNLMGETNDCQTPIAVAGRVLVYPYQNRENYHAGMAVCSAPDGTIDIMTREEIRDYPDCIIGIVSEIPQYEKWGSNQVDVDGRIWIKVK